MIGTKLAHYEITGHLGTGGMGEVYQASDAKLGRSVAIKLLPEAFRSDPDRAARFEREARVLASLNHPNIAAIHGIEESDGRKFLVMELVPGETLPNVSNAVQRRLMKFWRSRNRLRTVWTRRMKKESFIEISNRRT
jgi:serine/threonine protein kinase